MDNLDKYFISFKDLEPDDNCTLSTSSQTPPVGSNLNPAVTTGGLPAGDGDQFSFKAGGDDYLKLTMEWNNQFQVVVQTNQDHQLSYHPFSFDQQILEFREQLRQYEEKTDPGKNKCDKCDASFRFKQDLAAHIKKKHPNPPVIFTEALPCSLCGEKFVNFDEFRVHRKEKHPKIGFECETCGKKYEKKPNLRKHEKTHRKRGEPLKNQVVREKLLSGSITAEKVAEIMNKPAAYVDTKKVSKDLKEWLKNTKTSRVWFAVNVMERAKRTLRDHLNNPKDWNNMVKGQEIFLRMHNWMAISENERQAILRFYKTEDQESENSTASPDESFRYF